MKGNYWQIECASPLHARHLKEALWSGKIGQVVDYATKYLMVYIHSSVQLKQKEQEEQEHQEQYEEKKRDVQTTTSNPRVTQ